MSSLSVVLPAYNKFDITERCLGSLLENSLGAHQLTIVDNASTDETPNRLPEWVQKFTAKGWSVQVLTNTVNVGFGRAMNQGARASVGDYLALVSNDVYVLPGWDQALSKALDNDPSLDLVFPFINETHPFDAQRITDEGMRFQSRNKGRRRKRFTGVLMFFRKPIFDKLGGFDERYYVSYEDTDLRVRMDNAGMKYRMIGDCFIWHHAMATRGDAKHVPSNHEAEGRAKFIEKWGFDFSEREQTQRAKWHRRWVRFLNRRGYL